MSQLQLVTGVELAKVIDVGPETIRKWRKTGLIPAVHINCTTIRYDIHEVIETLKARSPQQREHGVVT